MAEGGDSGVKEKPHKKELSISEKIEKAVALKEDGNQHFKSGDYKDAVKKYNYALLYLKGLGEDPTSQIVPGVKSQSLTKSQKETRNKTLFACYNNLSGCMLKEERWDRVIRHATSALELQPEGNSRTFYRRGTAYLATGNLDSADSDLKRAAVLSPNDPAVNKQLIELGEKMKEFRKKEKEIYSGMFVRKNKITVEKN
ncbi:Tetratricopeptide repeat protein 9C-like [Oopsacas minuta]|uniref:Tetratricopeptide repeat protein 9C-like n=1 Tax=Oopsacas minuta TaxID=111878 RepID=A0AAV7K2W4_9METZ|nr:Tetratricopeptide repeat protein 9C-like [Oopsacas minuta]